MKTARKCLAILLSLLLLAGSFSTVFFVSAESGDEAYYFNAAQDFSREQNPNGVWTYQYRHNNGSGYTYTNLPFEVETNLWRIPGVGYIGTSPTNQVDSNELFVLTTPEQQIDDLVVAFTAPYSGIISLAMTAGAVYAPHQSTDAVRFSILKNDKVISEINNLDAEYNHNKLFAQPTSLVVAKGDVIRFVVGKNNFDPNPTTYFNPEITYTETFKTTYNAVEDFSYENNPNGVWGYQFAHDNGDSFTFTPLSVLNVSNQWDTAANYGGMARIGIHTGDMITTATDPMILFAADQQENYAALTFTAPYSGTVNVRLANGGAFSPYQSIGNARFRLIHNNDVLKSIDNLDATYNASNRFFDDVVTLNVKSGDIIAFAVSRNVPDEGSVLCNPEVSYTSIVKDTFRATDSYTTTNNPNGFWSYQYRQNTGSGYDYYDIGFDSSISQWNGGGCRMDLVIGDYVSSMTCPVIRMAADQEANDSVLTFTAPYSGTVNVSMANRGVFAPWNGEDGVRFNMLHNDTNIISVNDLDNGYVLAAGNWVFQEPQVLEVKAGDKIRFTVGRNAAIDSTTYLDPVIKYTSIIEEEPAIGNAYYFSNSAGNDAYIGTNPSAAWKSLSKIAELNLKSGDRIYLKAGDEWNEQLVINGVSATKELPCVITSFGSGANPKINLGLVEDPATPASELAVPVVLVNNAEGLEIQNLTITGSGVGIDLHYDNSFNNEYVKIENCQFDDLTGFHQVDGRAKDVLDRYYVAGAVTVTLTNSSIAIKDPALIGLYIDGCTTNRCGTLYSSAAYPYNTNEGNSISVSGLYITNSEMYNNDYYGTIIAGVEGGYIDGCKIIGCGAADYYAPGTAGIMISTKDYAIINTEIATQQRAGVEYDGVGIDFEWNCENILVENCWIHNNTGAGLFFYDSNNSTSGMENKNITVKNCAFEDNATAATGDSADPITDIRVLANASVHSLINSVISNNIYCNENADYEFVSMYQSSPETANNTIEGNTEGFLDGFLADSALSESVIENLGSYNSSEYTVDTRVGYYNINGEGIVTDTYKFSEAFGSTMGVWQYKYYTGEWTDMTFDANQNYWVYGLGGLIHAGGVHPANSETPAIVFKAPKAGRIRIKMEDLLSVASSSADGVVVSILNGKNELITDPIALTPADNNKALQDVFVNVAADESIYFCVSKHDSNMADSTTIRPIIEYVVTPTSLNEDDNIDILDFIRLKKHMVDSNVTLAGDADFDGDGRVESSDVIIMRKYILGVFNIA